MSEASGSAIQRVKSWVFIPRERTTKYYSDMEHSSYVSIYEKETSPAIIVKKWLLALIPYGILGVWIYGIVARPLPDSLGLTLLWGLTAVIVLLFAFVAVGLTLQQVRGWWDRVFGRPYACDECGLLTSYPETFSHKTGIGTSNEHRYGFCSTGCREAWEREHVEYEFSGYYDIQSGEDETRVKEEHYSSMWEVDADVQ